MRWLAIGCGLLSLLLSGCAVSDTRDGDAGRHEPDGAGDPASEPSGAASADAGSGGAGRFTDALLQKALGAGPLTIIDARPAAAFARGHLSGAHSVDVGRLRAEVDGVPGQVAPVMEVASVLGEAGVEPDLPALVYGQESDLAAARLVWTLSLMGHGPVHLLDGGYAAWQSAGHPVSTGSEAHTASDYPDDHIDESVRVDTDWILARLADPDVVLVDARTLSEFDAGHIPGALSRDWQGNVSNGRLLPLSELDARHADIPRDATVVAYCQTGSRAAMTWFVLRELGYADARLYDGSMAAWTQDPTRPLE